MRRKLSIAVFVILFVASFTLSFLSPSLFDLHKNAMFTSLVSPAVAQDAASDLSSNQDSEQVQKKTRKYPPGATQEEIDTEDQIINDGKNKKAKSKKQSDSLNAVSAGLKQVIKQSRKSDKNQQFSKLHDKLDNVVSVIENNAGKLTTNAQYDALFSTLTPASDLVFAGFAEYQLLFGRLGNDAIEGFNQNLSSTQTPNHIDLEWGNTEVVGIYVLVSFLNTLGGNPPGGGVDTFVLGDWKNSYYNTSGYNDFAFILDFQPKVDIIQLQGTAQDYQFVSVPFLGTGIYQKNDLVGVVFWDFDLKASDANVRYVGNTPPAGPVQSQIKQLGTAGIDSGTNTTTDSLGNVYVSGFTNSALGGTNAGSYDAWIAKYNSDGKQVWIRQFGSAKSELPFGLATDKSGNLYVSGGTQGNIAGTSQAPALEGDAWLAKYDSNGNQLWIKQFGNGLVGGVNATDIAGLTGPGTTYTGNIDASSMNALDIDDSGNVYVTGLTVTDDTRDIAIINAQDDFWVSKYDSNGNQQWFTQVGTPLSYPAIWDEAYDIEVTKDGSIYVTGWTYGGLEKDNANIGTYDAWITKFSNSGQVQWIKQFGSTSFDFSWAIDSDSNGNVYAYGWTKGDFAGQNAGPDDLFLVKYSPDGTQVWAKQFGTSNDDGAFIGGLKIDSNNNIFVTGYTNGSLGGPNAGSFDPWVARYDTNGNRVWVQQFGTSERDFATNIGLDNRGSLYLTGYTEGSLGSVNKGGPADAWVAKLDANSGTLQAFNKN